MPDPSPAVSVVVPTYNGEAHVDRCLRSLVAQRGVAIEVIVVDDGSDDRTVEIASSHPVLVVQQAHAGVAVARNRGMAVAAAPIVGFCDQDDEWLPDKAAQQVARLDDDPALGVVLCRQHVVLAPDVQQPSWLVADVRGDLGGVQPVSGLFRMTSIAAVGGFDEHMPLGEDLDLLVRIRERGDGIDVLDERLVVRHVHERNTSNEHGTYAPAIFEVYRRRARRSRA